LIPNPVLHGGTSRSVGEKGAREIPNSSLVVIPNAGHFVMVDQPAVYDKTVLDFLAQ